MTVLFDNDNEGRTCTKCGEWKCRDKFSLVTTRGKKHIASQCKACRAKITKLIRNDPDWKSSDFGRMTFGVVVPEGFVPDSKICTKCCEEKRLDDFYSDKTGRFGRRVECKECSRAATVAARSNDIDRAREYGRTYYAAHRDKLLKAANDNISTPRGKIDNAISCGVSRGIRRGSKNGRASFDLLGFSLDALMAHLEKLFTDGMTWENYGFYGWHIDHIKPLASFNYNSPDDPEFKEAWALSNLRPLWSTENWSKGARDLAA